MTSPGFGGTLPPTSPDGEIVWEYLNPARGGEKGKPVYNYRSDGREFPRGRCLIVADGFYEWKSEGGGRRPYRIARRDGAPFAFAGLWSSWKDPERGDRGGEPLETFTILTTSPNEAVRPLHDRMPVILDASDFERWLDPAAGGAELVVTTPPAEKIYRSEGDTAEIATTIRVADGGRLDWVPQETILYDAARLRRSLDVELEEGASALLFEATVFGRAAFGGAEGDDGLGVRGPGPPAASRRARRGRTTRRWRGGGPAGRRGPGWPGGRRCRSAGWWPGCRRREIPCPA